MAPTKNILEKLGWSNLKERRNTQKALMMFKIINGMTPVYLKDMFSKNIGTSCYNLRTSREDIALPRARTDYYRNSFAFTGAKIWNSFPNDLKCERSVSNTLKTNSNLSTSVSIFKYIYISYFFKKILIHET